jgi:alpha-amylase
MSVRFVLCIHNHQPVGNFGFVLENAHRLSYVPFLEVLERHPGIRAVFHFSGILLRWFEHHHPDYLDRLAALAAQDRAEFLSGGFYEPILAVIPERDRVGQVKMMNDWIAARFGRHPQGLWLTERVWEPTLPGSLAAAGIGHVVVDDFHLRAAGVSDEEITRPCLTDDGDAVVAVIGGNERLRYLLPYEEPERVIEFLRSIHLRHPDQDVLVTMADDGEKFGVWPGTHRRVYQEGWLDALFDLVEENAGWLVSDTYGGALAAVPPRDLVYLPTCSYMEMSQWTLPPPAQERYLAVKDLVTAHGELGYVTHFLRGGYWRNFLARYPESRFLSGRMHGVSERLHRAAGSLPPLDATAAALLEEAREGLYQSQCNDVYWHGVFGGLYLPFLRAATWESLIRAEAALDGLERGGDPDAARIISRDWDGDREAEFQLLNRHLAVTVDPAAGSALELSHRSPAINLANSLTRREEAYHKKIRDLGTSPGGGEVKSIHHLDGMREGQAVPEVVLDDYRRLLFTDHLWRGAYRSGEWRSGRQAAAAPAGPFTAHRQALTPEAALLELSRPEGRYPATRKTYRLDALAPRLEVSLGFDAPGGFVPFQAGTELNLTPTSLLETAVTATNVDGRSFPVPPQGIELADVVSLRLADGHKGLVLTVTAAEPCTLWAGILASVSNSEGGYEEIPQEFSFLLFRRISRPGEGITLTLDIQPSPGGAPPTT